LFTTLRKIKVTQGQQIVPVWFLGLPQPGCDLASKTFVCAAAGESALFEVVGKYANHG